MFEQLHSGELYDPGDAELLNEQRSCLERLYDFNTTRPSELEKRAAMLREIALSDLRIELLNVLFVLLYLFAQLTGTAGFGHSLEQEFEKTSYGAQEPPQCASDLLQDNQEHDKTLPYDFFF